MLLGTGVRYCRPPSSLNFTTVPFLSLVSMHPHSSRKIDTTTTHPRTANKPYHLSAPSTTTQPQTPLHHSFPSSLPPSFKAKPNRFRQPTIHPASLYLPPFATQTLNLFFSSAQLSSGLMSIDRLYSPLPSSPLLALKQPRNYYMTSALQAPCMCNTHLHRVEDRMSMLERAVDGGRR